MEGTPHWCRGWHHFVFEILWCSGRSRPNRARGCRDFSIAEWLSYSAAFLQETAKSIGCVEIARSNTCVSHGNPTDLVGVRFSFPDSPDNRLQIKVAAHSANRQASSYRHPRTVRIARHLSVSRSKSVPQDIPRRTRSDRANHHGGETHVFIWAYLRERQVVLFSGVATH